MRLAFVIFRYFPYGGLQRDMLAIAQAALVRGHQVTVFCSAWQGDVPHGIEVVQLHAKGLLSRVGNTAGVKYFVAAFAQQYDTSQFDALVGFNKMPGLDIYYCGDSCFAKKAYEERGFLYRLAPRSRLYLQYEDAVYSHLSHTHILEVSSAERPVFAKYYATPAERQTLLPPGIDPQLVLPPQERARARAAIRAELGLAASTPVILCVGSGFKTKGLDRSLRSFAEFHKRQPNARLLVVGNGNVRPFHPLIAALGIAASVRFLGGRQDMARVYAAGDLLLHPAYKEVAGNVIVEAMVCALPVLATPVCGYAHYITDAAMGELLASPDNPTRVAEQMAELLSIPSQHWQQQAVQLAQSSDLFSRPERAIAEIEHRIHAPHKSSFTHTDDNSAYTLCDELIDSWSHSDTFPLLENIRGEVARETRDRQTCRFSLNGKTYYRKWHRGVGWREIVKNLLQWRLPVLGANTEWDALHKLRALGIPSLIPVAYGVRGKNPARQQSFIVTRELPDVMQLDHYLERQLVPVKTRRALLLALAQLVRQLHEAGINHRDLYLCHFMVKPEQVSSGEPPRLYIIDLHRAQCRPQVPLRWQIKDLAALYFSTLNLGFSQRESLRFLKAYFGLPLGDILCDHTPLLARIRRKALKIYWRDYGHAPPKLY